ncbi:MAG: hypothetical protein ABIJ57_16660, partial [Pseudomonadota bacterium]
TIFAELDLDTSRYLKSQQKLLQDATHTTLNIEQNFKNLGVKSSAEMDLMRAKITNSFDMIANSSKATANDILRAEQAKNDKLKQLNEQQYGAQTSTLGKMKDNWLATSAAIVAAGYAVSKVVGAVSGVVMASARYETLGIVMRVVGNNAGYTGEQMTAFQLGLEKTGISMSGSRQALTRMAQAQLDLTKSTQLGRIAQDAAVIGAMNSTEAFNQMVYGIQSANVRVLRTIGINVSFEESYQKVAKQLGRTAASFTESEKAAIRLQAVLDVGPTIAGAYEGAMETAGKQLFSLERHFDNLKVLAGAAFTPALAEMVQIITGTVTDLNSELGGESKDAIQTWATNLRIGIISVEAEFMRVAMLLDKIGGTMTSAQMLLYGPGALLGFESSQKRFEDAAKANIEYEDRYKATDKALEALALKQIKLEESLTDAGKAAAKAAEKAGEQRRMAAIKTTKAIIEETEKEKKAREAAAKEDQKLIDQGMTAWLKAIDEKEDADIKAGAETIKRHKDEAKADQKLIDQGMTEWLKAIDEKEDADIKAGKDMLTRHKKEADERLRAERDVYSDLRGYDSQYYEASKALIDKQAQAYRELGVDEVAVAAWVAEEHQKAENKKLLATGTFVDGVNVGLREMEKNTLTFGKAGYDTFNTFATSSKTALSTILFDSIKTGTFDAQKVWESFADTMLKKLTDTIAQMIVQWGIYQAAMYAASAFGFQLPGGIINPFAAATGPGSVIGAGASIYGALQGGTTAAGAAGFGAGGAGMAMAPTGFGAGAGGAGMAAAPSGFGAAGMGPLATAGLVAGTVLAPLAIYGLLGGFSDEAGAPATQFTPEGFAFDHYYFNRNLNMAGMISGGENFMPIDLAKTWKDYYDAWFTIMAQQYGTTIPKTMTTEQAWAQAG